LGLPKTKIFSHHTPNGSPDFLEYEKEKHILLSYASISALNKAFSSVDKWPDMVMQVVLETSLYFSLNKYSL
jgi:hypothetical protein